MKLPRWRDSASLRPLVSAGTKACPCRESGGSLSRAPIATSMKRPRHVIAADLFLAPQSGTKHTELLSLVKRIVSDSECTVIGHEPGRVTVNAPTELILESLLIQINEQHQLAIKASACYVLYLETITRSADGEGKEIRHSKERDHYAHVKLTLHPSEVGQRFEFVNAIQDDAIPEKFIPAVHQAISKGLQRGVLKGFPVVDVSCTLFDGSYHEIDSSNAAFEEATFRALADALRKADPVFLEPIMRFEVRAPEEFIPFLLGDLKRRRARIHKTDTSPHGGLVEGLVALAQVLGYHRVPENDRRRSTTYSAS